MVAKDWGYVCVWWGDGVKYKNIHTMKLTGVSEIFCSLIEVVLTQQYIFVKIHPSEVNFTVCKLYLNKFDLTQEKKISMCVYI